MFSRVEQQVYRRGYQEFASVLEPVRSFDELPKLFDGCDPVAVTTTLNRAFDLHCMSRVSDNRHRLLACLKRWALSALNPAVNGGVLLPTVKCNDLDRVASKVRSFRAWECRCILANAFLGNVFDTMAKHKFCSGGLCFWKMMRRDNEIVAHKTAALLLYFHAGMELEGTEDDQRLVEFHHLRGIEGPNLEDITCSPNDTLLVGNTGSTNKEGHGTIMEFDHVRLHGGKMEDVGTASAFVNFANEQFGFGEFIPSCTQEEILQVCCPEFNVGMLFIAIIEDDEVVNVYNCRRFSSYTGYLDNFRCTGPISAQAPECVKVQHILTMDASKDDHYSMENVLRDILKAHLSFKGLVEYTNRHAEATVLDRNSMVSVSTGKWGCGAFDGTPSHKLLQQVLAARMAGVKIHFSTFGSLDSCDLLLEALKHRRATVSEAWELLCRCRDWITFEEQVGIPSEEMAWVSD